jgi:NTE family protein
MPRTEANASRDLALCLAGGGGLGFTHIGLLEAMEELDIRPSLVVGTSMGAVLGAFYAAGKSTADIRDILEHFKWSKVVALSLPHLGVLSTHSMQQLFQKHLGDLDISDLPIKLKVAALKLKTGELTQFSEGPLAKCLAASCAVAGLFQPVMIKGHEYYDAGPVYNLPLELVNGERKKRIIAGNTVGRYGLLTNPRTLDEVLYQTYLIQLAHQSIWRAGPLGWIGKDGEEVILIDYRTKGANPTRLYECLSLIDDTRKSALAVLKKAFDR